MMWWCDQTTDRQNFPLENKKTHKKLWDWNFKYRRNRAFFPYVKITLRKIKQCKCPFHIQMIRNSVSIWKKIVRKKVFEKCWCVSHCTCSTLSLRSQESSKRRAKNLKTQRSRLILRQNDWVALLFRYFDLWVRLSKSNAHKYGSR